MFCVANRIFRVAFSRFKGGLLKLECSEGSYNHMPFNVRICTLCKSDIETAYNFLLLCPNLSQIRSQYISFIGYKYPFIMPRNYLRFNFTPEMLPAYIVAMATLCCVGFLIPDF